VFTYQRTGKPDDPVCAVTGGYVVRDRSLPVLDGRYLYADFCRGEIHTLPARGDAGGDRRTGLRVPELGSFAVDAAGHPYAISLGGDVYRIAQR
jgi:hypothetical protein